MAAPLLFLLDNIARISDVICQQMVQETDLFRFIGNLLPSLDSLPDDIVARMTSLTYGVTYWGA